MTNPWTGQKSKAFADVILNGAKMIKMSSANNLNLEKAKILVSNVGPLTLSQTSPGLYVSTVQVF